MSWAWDEIKSQWLAGSKVAMSPRELVQTFNRAEEVLGRDWVENHRLRPGGVITGVIPVIAVASMGKRLLAVGRATGLSAVTDRIRTGDRAARTELTAAYLCAPHGDRELEFAAGVKVGNRDRVPDFRIRITGEPWTYVEVTAPDVSELQHEASKVIDRLVSLLPRMPVGSAAEVMLRRDPTSDEISLIEQSLLSLVQAEEPVTADLPGLALLLSGYCAPGQVVVDDHGEPSLPRIGMVRAEGDSTGPKKHITVRYPFADQRAESFLTSEARQLPKGEAGVVMIDISQATGAVESWVPLLQRRLQPTQHTRVSAIVLFSGGVWSTAEGEAWIPYTRAIVNPSAAITAPAWLIAQLEAWRPPDKWVREPPRGNPCPK